MLIGVFFNAKVFHKMSPLPPPQGISVLKASCCDFDGSLQKDLTDAGGKGFVVVFFGFCLWGLLFSWGMILTLGWGFKF